MMSTPQISASLAVALPDPSESELTRLHQDLASRAHTEGILDVTYQVVDSPHGRLLLAATEAGVVRVAFEREGHDEVVASLARTISPRILATDIRTREAARQLDEYFAGRRREFVLDVDLRLVSGFRRSVLGHLARVPYGATVTYSAMAAAAGNAKAVRAAGSACSHNPVPLVIPCHRVVRSDGTIGNYLGGSDTKAALLALESVA